jgi:hypothetical protein
MNDLSAFIEARLAEDEQWALAASQPYQYADGSPPVPLGGVHWEWVGGGNWDPATVNPVEHEFVTTADGYWGVNLGSVETWRSGLHDMRAVVADEMVEVKAGPAGHIVRHDPARALREVEAKRRLLAQYQAAREQAHNPRDSKHYELARLEQGALRDVLELLASVWSDHPDYRAEWRAA